MKKINFLLILIISAALIVWPGSSWAATFNIKSSSPDLIVGDQVEFRVLVDTNNESINALAGSLEYSKETLRLDNFSDASSIINLWLERPSLDNSGLLKLSGIIPGGYSGSQGLVLTLNFTVIKSGAIFCQTKNWQILKNDGQGQEVLVKNANLSLIAKENQGNRAPMQLAIKDIDRPEAFSLELVKEDGVNQGKWFVAFATQDKGSGLATYEILETKNFFAQEADMPIRGWEPVTSPYVLTDQSLSSYVYVRAIDRAGNLRLAYLAPTENQRQLVDYKKVLIWCIILGGVLFVLLILLLKWRQKKRQK